MPELMTGTGCLLKYLLSLLQVEAVYHIAELISGN